MYFTITLELLYNGLGSTGLPLATQAPPTVPGSTATTTIAPPAAAANNALPAAATAAAAAAPAAPNAAAGNAAFPVANSLDAAAVLPSNVVPPQTTPAKVKKGESFILHRFHSHIKNDLFVM